VGAVLAPFHTLRVLPLVLISKEVAVSALGALEYHFVSWHLYVGRVGKVGKVGRFVPVFPVLPVVPVLF
jgi:hypothetical protein